MFQTTNQTSTTVFLGGVYQPCRAPSAFGRRKSSVRPRCRAPRLIWAPSPAPHPMGHLPCRLGGAVEVWNGYGHGKKIHKLGYTLWLWYPMISTYNWHCSPKYRWYRRMTKDEDSKELTILILCYAYACLCFIDSTSFNIFLLISQHPKSRSWSMYHYHFSICLPYSEHIGSIFTSTFLSLDEDPSR